MNRRYGKKYDQDLSTKEIAARVRGDIKAAQAAGTLPAGFRFSVRTDHYSMGSSIDVTVTRITTGFVIRQPGYHHDMPAPRPPRPWLTRAAYAVEVELEAILAAYNHDGSDSMQDIYDVRFSSNVGWSHGLAEEALAA